MDLHRTLISAEALAARLAAGAPSVLLDCRFDLSDPSAGLAAYAAAHLPGARYAHLDEDLSGAKTGRNGRHPLPDIAALAAWAGAMGIAPGVQVVAYDDVGGPYASRCWWLLRWLGHDAVAVLDGGVSAWRAIGGAIERGAPASPIARQPLIPPRLRRRCRPSTPTRCWPRSAGCAWSTRATQHASVARLETLDPVAGRIPGATLRAFQDNLLPNGRFKPAAQLRAEFEDWATPAAQVVHQCGSGVTACHNLLAMVHAGLEGSVLYPGSWSEWCADPARPIARG
jgi:thiosulfate/3-mercaptopyruvate sulfurtransferase